MKRIMYMLVLVPAIAFVGCSEEDEAPDYVAESVGTYSYSVNYTLVADANDTDSDTGVMTIAQSGSNITIVLDGGTSDEVTITGEKVTTASNGYAFDIRSFNGTEDGVSYTVTGIDGTEIDGVNYDGRYDSGSGQVFFNVLVDYESGYDEFNYTLETVANKN